MNIANRQEHLVVYVENILKEDREHHNDCRKYGHKEMQKIERSVISGPSQHRNEVLPNKFYRDIVDSIRRRISSCEEDIALFSQQLISTTSMSASGSIVDSYGHQIKVGPKELIKLLKLQNETFIRISSTVAKVNNFI